MLMVADKALGDFKDACLDTRQKDSVVIGLAPEHFNYNILNEAFRYLRLLYICRTKLNKLTYMLYLGFKKKAMQPLDYSLL